MCVVAPVLSLSALHVSHVCVLTCVLICLRATVCSHAFALKCVASFVSSHVRAFPYNYFRVWGLLAGIRHANSDTQRNTC